MTEFLTTALLALPAIFLVVDPLATVPILISVTARDTPQVRHATARRAALVCGLVLLTFAVAGSLILRGFGITLGAFRISGGILLLRIALEMLDPRATAARTETTVAPPSGQSDPGTTPLGVPLLAGPGAITTCMVLSSRARSWQAVAAVLVSIGVVAFATWLILRGADVIQARMSQTLTRLFGPLMGLILGAIAVEFAVAGIRDMGARG